MREFMAIKQWTPYRWTSISIQDKPLGTLIFDWIENKQFAATKVDQQANGVKLHYTLVLYWKGKENTVADA